MFTLAFLVAAVERATKSAAQAVLLNLGASDVGVVNLFEANAANIAGFAAGGFVLSVLTSVISSGVSAGPSLAPKAEVDAALEGLD